jgi:hypothetical protein
MSYEVSLLGDRGVGSNYGLFGEAEKKMCGK